MKYFAELEFATNLAKDAGEIMLKYFRSEDIGVTWKADNSRLTKADILINDLVINSVKSIYPTYGIWGEEASYEKERELIWIVDPIDGTAPYSLGMPLSTFLLALVDRKDGQPVVAVAYEPFTDQLYSAVKGQGAYLNGQKIFTSKNKEIVKGYVSLYGPPLKKGKVDYSPGRMWDDIKPRGVKNFIFASAGFTAVKVANGDFLAIVAGPDNPWDTAPISLIIKEAGGVVTDLEGKSRRHDDYGAGIILAANESILNILLEYTRAK